MARFFKRPWDEPRGDEYDAWGTSVYYLHVDEQSYPERQLVIYSSGEVPAYDREHWFDEYGASAINKSSTTITRTSATVRDHGRRIRGDLASGEAA